MRLIFILLVQLVYASGHSQNTSFLDTEKLSGSMWIRIGVCKDSTGFSHLAEAEINERIFPIYVTYQVGNGVYFNVDSVDRISAIIIESKRTDSLSMYLTSVYKSPDHASQFGTSDQGNNLYTWDFSNCTVSIFEYPIFQGLIIYNANKNSFSKKIE